MVAIKEFGNGYYIVNKHNKKDSLGWTTIFPVRARDKKNGYISITHIISTPEELVGKKVRFKVEVIEDAAKNKQ